MLLLYQLDVRYVQSHPMQSLQTLAVPSAHCTYPHIHVWYLQQPRLERKRGYRQTVKLTNRLTDRPTDYNNSSLRMRARGLITITCLMMHHDNHYMQRGDSALMWAAYNGHAEVVQQMVKAGANLNLQNIVRWYVEI